jgi:hypothetical protein
MLAVLTVKIEAISGYYVMLTVLTVKIEAIGG